MKKENLEKVWPVSVRQDGGNFDDSRFYVVVTGEFLRSLKILLRLVDFNKSSVEDRVVWGFIYNKLNEINKESSKILAQYREEMKKLNIVETECES